MQDVKIDFSLLDRPKKIVIHHFVLSEELSCEDCFYLYDLDVNSPIYRVTAYQNFTNANCNYGVKISVEEISNSEMNLEEVRDRIIEKLKVSNLISEKAKIIFSDSKPIESGFPIPSIKNIEYFEKLRSKLSELYSNCTLVGLNSSPKLFFYRDILKDVLNKVNMMTKK